jgi:hypothetical protein
MYGPHLKKCRLWGPRLKTRLDNYFEEIKQKKQEQKKRGHWKLTAGGSNRQVQRLGTTGGPENKTKSTATWWSLDTYVTLILIFLFLILVSNQLKNMLS